MSVKLLFYNPNLLAHRDNFELAGIERFSYFFKMFNSNVVMIDRTNTIRIPAQVTSLFPMPTLRPISKSFEDICNERATELLKRADVLDVRLHVFYSGGIDSTLMLISLLKNATPAQKARIVVLLSEDSIEENPNFYQDHIRGKLNTSSSVRFPYLLGTRDMVVGGEFNDQLFGSDKVKKLIERFGTSVIHAPYNRNVFFEFFNEAVQDPDTTNFYLDLFERLKAAAPLDISSNYLYLWWINFALKWQSVFLRMLVYTAPHNVHNVTREYIEKEYSHFYGTEDFQLWSMNNPDKRIKDAWNTYKWVCKDIIYEYTKDADYRDNKTKRGSLFHLLLQQSSFNFIDESMRFYTELDRSEYYNPDNDFIQK